jgi:hypothetical protein
MHIKYLENLKHMLAISEEGREHEVQLEKPTIGLTTPDLMMSRAKIERHSGACVDSGHDLLVENSGISSTSMQQGMGHCVQ